MKVFNVLNLLFMKRYNSEFSIITFCFISFIACNQHDNKNETGKKDSISEKERESFNFQKQKLENEKRKLDLVESKQKESKRNNKAKLEIQRKKYEDDLVIKKRTLDLKEKSQNIDKKKKKIVEIEKKIKENYSLIDDQSEISVALPVINSNDSFIEEDAISEENNNIDLENLLLENRNKIDLNNDVESTENENEIEATWNEIHEFLNNLGERNTSSIDEKLMIFINKLNPYFFKKKDYCIRFLRILCNRLKKNYK